MPRYFGKPNTVYKAYQRWFRSNKLVQLFALLIRESDLEWVFIDGTHIKVHQHSSGGNERAQAISKSVAYRATKIYLAVDFHGNPITFVWSDGTTRDVKIALELVDKIDLSDTDMVCADKGYDFDKLREHIKQARSFDNIPKREIQKLTTTIWTGTCTRLAI